MLYIGSQRDGPRRWGQLTVIVVAFLLSGMVGGCDEIGGQAEDRFSTRVATHTLTTGAMNVDQVDRGQYGKIVEGTQRVLRDEEAYASFWERLHTGRTPVPDRPEVDFENRVVIAIVQGRRPTGGYRVEVDEVWASKDEEQIQVQFTETVPGEGCIVTQAATSPYVLVTVEAQGEEVTFVGAEETRSC